MLLCLLFMRSFHLQNSFQLVDLPIEALLQDQLWEKRSYFDLFNLHLLGQKGQFDSSVGSADRLECI